MAQLLLSIACGIGIVFLVSRASGLVKYLFLVCGMRRGAKGGESLPAGFPGRELFEAGQALAD